MDYFETVGLHDVFTADIPDPQKDRHVYSILLSVLFGEPLTVIDNSAKKSGKLAYKLLCEQYMGNANSRKINGMNALFSVQIINGESLSNYLSRIESIRKTMSEFNYFPDDHVYILKALHGLPDNYDTFKTVINAFLSTHTWTSFKEQLLNLVLLQAKPTDKQATIMTVSTDNRPTPTVQETNKQNYKQFVQSSESSELCKTCYGDHPTEECKANKWCHECNNKSHNSHECRNYRGDSGKSIRARGSHQYRGAKRGGNRGYSGGNHSNGGQRGGAYGSGGSRFNNYNNNYSNYYVNEGSYPETHQQQYSTDSYNEQSTS